VGHLRSRKNSKKRFFSKFLLQIMKQISSFKSSRPRGDVQLDLSNFFISSVCHNDLPIFPETVFRFLSQDGIAMPTKRQYLVDLPKANSQLTSNGYILSVNVMNSKKAKQEPPREFTQYVDIRYARADAARLEDHYLANKRLRTFQPDYDGAIYSSLCRE